MKNIFSFALAFLIIISCFFMAGCSQKSLRDEDFASLITFPKYKEMEIDTTSAKYQMGIIYAHYSNLIKVYEKLPQTGLDEGVVQILDTAIIDYVGTINGKTFEGGSDKGYDLQIGSSQFIDGFEEGLIGAKVGETVNLKLTFPKDYSAQDLAGKNVEFAVTIKGILRPEIPEITDDFAESFGAESADKYFEILQTSYLYQFAWTEFLSKVEVKEYPKYAIDKYIKDNINQLKKEAESNSVTLEEYLSDSGYTEETYKNDVLTITGQSYVKNVMAAYHLGKLENFTVIDSEFEKYLSEKYSQQELTKQEKETVFESLMVEKAIEKLASFVKIKE